MADIKTMTQEITDLNIDLKESMLDGDYLEFGRGCGGNK